MAFYIPLWLVFVIVIILAIIGWKLIKFALKILLIIIVIFGIAIVLDMLNFLPSILP